MLVDRPRHQASRRSRVGPASTRVRPLETRFLGGVEQVHLVGALERICEGFFAFFGPGDGVGGTHAWRMRGRRREGFLIDGVVSADGYLMGCPCDR